MMSVRWRNGGFVKYPGIDIVLGNLKPDVKAQVWRGMKKTDPAKSDALRALSSNASIQSLQKRLAVSPVITEAEFKQYLRSGQVDAKSS